MARSRASRDSKLTSCPSFSNSRPDVLVDRQLGAALDQVVQLGAVGGERRPLVEGDLVDSHPVPEVGEETEQGLANRARAHDVDDLLHGSLTRNRLKDETKE